MTKLTVGINGKTNNTGSEYPFLGITEAGTIVLFEKKRHGVVIQPGGTTDRSAGDYSASWIMEKFKPFTGSITLTQT